MKDRGQLTKVIGMLDLNDDGEVDVWDMTHLIVRHEWMMVAGGFIFIGAIGNVLSWWDIDSDAYWAAAGMAAMLEYIDDTRRVRRARREERKKK